MKKISILLVVFGIFLSYSFLFAAETGASESGYYELVIMLDNSKTISDSQVMLIRDLARDLTPRQRYMLYESHKKSATLPFALNFLLGAGIGSFVQGDVAGGVAGMVCDLLAFSIYYSGMIQNIEAQSSWSSTGEEGMEMVAIGSALLIGSKLYQWIRPFSYAKKQNRNLSRSLDVGLAVMPTVNKEGDFQMRVAASFSF